MEKKTLNGKRVELFCTAKEEECPEDFNFEKVWHYRYLGNCLTCKYLYFKFVPISLK